MTEMFGVSVKAHKIYSILLLCEKRFLQGIVWIQNSVHAKLNASVKTIRYNPEKIEPLQM